MKWAVLAFILCFATFSKQGVLKDVPESSSQTLSDDIDFIVKAIEEGILDEVECLAGSEWESNCHTCKCSDEGRAVCVKADGCDRAVSEKPHSCKANTTFKRDCNMCGCLENGLVLCTLKGCGVDDHLLPKVELPSGKDCAPGSYWKNKCNECMCTPEGLPACTEIGCLGHEDKPDMQCAPDTVWKYECNNCWCTADGLPTCTRVGCHSSIITDFKPDSSEEVQQQTISEVNPKKVNIKNIASNEIDHNLVKRNPDELVCKPNTSFKIDCNFCDCDAVGRSYSCTDSECVEEDNPDVEVFMEGEDGVDHVEHSLCKPRGTFYITCNVCQCSADGTNYSCTNKTCPLPADVEVFHEIRESRLAVDQNQNKTKAVVCPANRMFIMDCNTCWCNSDGTSYICTRKVCVDGGDDTDQEKLQVPQDAKRKCKPGEVFELECNTCRCNADGGSFSCTRRACPVDEDKQIDDLNAVELVRKTRATPQDLPKNCQPGQEFRMDCNKCLCDNEGQNYSCTRIDCAALGNNNGGVRSKREISNQMDVKCSPGSVFDQGCNVCRCSEDGAHANCTLRRCRVDKVDHTQDAENQAGSDTSFRCNPGEQFKRECNDCTCSADGKTVFCTLRLCDQDIATI